MDVSDEEIFRSNTAIQTIEYMNIHIQTNVAQNTHPSQGIGI